MWTGLAGVVAAAVAIVLLRDWLQPGWLKTLAVAGATAGAMVVVDALILRSVLNPSSGLASATVRPLDLARVGLKLVGFWSTIAVLALAYAVLDQYALDSFASFKSAALWLLPGLVVVAPLYIAYVDRRQHEPQDAYAQLGALVLGRRPANWRGLRLHAMGWVVKGFFLPLMFVFGHDLLQAVWARQALPTTFGEFFELAIDLFYVFDVVLAVVTYALTLRVFDSHIRSVEPTVWGWVVCLVCYPPFVDGTLRAYLNYDRDQLYWGQVFAPWPVLHVLWGSVILVLVAIYALSTASFGLRFSNLTNRGIIRSGPYRWVKHPAYLSKNLSWWLISVPFVAGAGWMVAIQSCLLLFCVNAIYYARAKTEERHLRADPAYREYEAFIEEHGLFAVVRRTVLRRFGREAAA